jgi:hypothetical protein
MRNPRLTLFALVGLLAASNPAAAAVSVVVAPASVSLPANGVQQFHATVFGSPNKAVRWLVNGVPGGAPSTGIISDAGLFTAPPDAPARLSVEIEAEPAAAPAAFGTAKAAIAAGPDQAPLYHVATNGSDGNPGSAAKPWLTIGHAVVAAPADARILVHAGTYNEIITIKRSGSSSAGFLSLEAAPGEQPIVDGSGLDIPGGQWGLVTIDGASWVRVKGFEIRNYRSTTQAVPIGLYVVGAGDHIEILDNHIHSIVTTLKTSNGDALGLAVYGSKAPASINWLTIDGNELDDLVTGYSESLSLSGNVEMWEIANNLIHDNNNIGVNVEGFYHTAPNPAYDQARRGLVAANTIYNITSTHNPAYDNQPGADGIYISGGTLVTVDRNLVHDTDLGIELASENVGRATTLVWARNNVVHHSLVTGISLGGANAKQNGGSTDNVVANNTLYFNDTTHSGSGELQIQFNASDNVVANNILDANGQGLIVNAFAKGSAAPASLDHNLEFSPDGHSSGSEWIWLGKSYSSYGGYRSGTGEDAASKFANPRFVDAATGNFDLESTSPAIGLGADLGPSAIGIVDFAGRPRVVGATVDAGALQR